MRLRPFPFIALTVVTLALVGCFEIEQSIELERDMSGTADLKIGVDMEPMVLIMATMQRQMEGKEGPPTEEELAKARTEFLEKESEGDKELPSVEEANAEMPEGIKILDMAIDEIDMRVISRFKFAFDTLAHLVNLELPSKGDEENPGETNALDSPFQNLELVEEGNTFTIHSKPVNPTHSVEEQVAEQAPPDPEMERMMEEAFRNLRFTWKIKAPFEVVSHNATQVDGDTLIWTYDIERFKQMEASGQNETLDIRVTYKKN